MDKDGHFTAGSNRRRRIGLGRACGGGDLVRDPAARARTAAEPAGRRDEHGAGARGGGGPGGGGGPARAPREARRAQPPPAATAPPAETRRAEPSSPAA